MPGKKTIFIIDDSNTNVVLLEAILGTRGYITQTALSVKEALPLIRKNKPSLILLDLLMPEISGYDFLEQVRMDDSLRDIPIIVVSALTDEMNVERSMELGAVEFIKKPVDITGLVEVVSKFV